MASKLTDTLDPEFLATLAQTGEVRTYAKNETIITEGTTSDALFVLLSGKCKVYTRDERGRELVYNVLEPQDLFGEMFLDGGVRSASVRATTLSGCIMVSQSRTAALVKSHPAFAEFLIVKLIERVRHSTRLIRSLALEGVHVRTAALLQREALLEDGVLVISAALTQQEIANRVGATREMVNQVIGGLLADGYLERDGKRRLTIMGEPPRQRPPEP